ncbi:hypothetical protein BC829DRAFT_405234 [Chytridium lagenaria]|nr:hypothetical protein BC829DRAFT_405234 [Chytridium lagenaria]
MEFIGGGMGGSSSAGVQTQQQGQQGPQGQQEQQGQEGEYTTIQNRDAAVMNIMEMLQQMLVGAGIVGNPGDYVFGQQGLDTIITQLMEQNTLRNAPPPASDYDIANLPRVKVRGSDLGEHPECAVCQDDFTNEGEGEYANRLLCGHHFHPDCIGNWLKVNGTCPVCRKRIQETATVDQVD